MPIVISLCPRCAESVEIDTQYAVVLTGTCETVWRVLRENCAPGAVINLQVIADMAFMHRSTVLKTLRQLERQRLVSCELKRPGGRYYRWRMGSITPDKITRAIFPTMANVA